MTDLATIPLESLIAEIERRQQLIARCQDSRAAWAERDGPILHAAANAFGLSAGKLFLKSRVRAIVAARYTAMTLLRLNRASYPEIAAIFGMHYASVMHAVKTHPDRMLDPWFAKRFTAALEALPKNPLPTA